LKANRESQQNGFKLKSVSQSMAHLVDNDIGGLDILCVDDVMNDEVRAMNKSGFLSHRKYFV
jgi:hypothetical protein